MTITKQVIYIHCCVCSGTICVSLISACSVHVCCLCLYNCICACVCVRSICLAHSYAHLRFTQSIVSIVTHFDVDGPCCLHGYFQDDFLLVFFSFCLCSKPSAYYYNTYGTYRYVCWLVTNNAKCVCAI